MNQPTKQPVSKVKTASGLTESQEAFARMIAWHPSKTITDCYLAAYPNFRGARRTAGQCASRLWAKVEVRSRVESLRDAFSAKCPLTRGEALTILGDIARDGTEASRLRIDAIRQLQSMIPAWNANPASEIPQSIAIQIVAGKPRPDALANHAASDDMAITVDVISETETPHPLAE